MTILHCDGCYREAGLGFGNVKRVADTEIVITDEYAKDWTYELTATARIRIDKKDVSVTYFKPGDPVVFVYAKKGDGFNLLNLCGCPKS